MSDRGRGMLYVAPPSNNSEFLKGTPTATLLCKVDSLSNLEMIIPTRSMFLTQTFPGVCTLNPE